MINFFEKDVLKAPKKVLGCINAYEPVNKVGLERQAN
jgi:hypothetical protein